MQFLRFEYKRQTGLELFFPGALITTNTVLLPYKATSQLNNPY